MNNLQLDSSLIWAAALLAAWVFFTCQVVVRVSFRSPLAIVLGVSLGLRFIVAAMLIIPFSLESVAVWLGADGSYRSLSYYRCTAGIYGFMISLVFTALEGILLWRFAKYWPASSSGGKPGIGIWLVYWITTCILILLIYKLLAFVCRIF